MSAAHPITYSNGAATWHREPCDRFALTGIDRDGQRFSMEHEQVIHLSCINVWRGSLWLVRGGRRYLIRRTFN